MTTLLRLLAVGFTLYFAFAAFLFLVQRRVMYPADNSPPSLIQAGLPDMSVVALATGDGLTLSAWYKAPATTEAPVVAYLHGNGGHIGYRGSKIRPFLDQGYGVLLVSWRGYGGNPGTPTEAGLYRDTRAALSFFARENIPAERVVFNGESLGSGPAVQIATEKNVRAVILEAPYTSMADVAQSKYWFLPARYLVKDKFDSLAKIADIDAPLLILHGARDRVVPVRFGRALIAAAQDPKTVQIFERAGHNDLYDHGAAEASLSFLREH
jgi:fermentation-respiration switch protein FrsA (DUF1100 family)